MDKLPEYPYSQYSKGIVIDGAPAFLVLSAFKVTLPLL